MTKLKQAYYQNDDVVWVAKDLIGKVLCVSTTHTILKSVISETEAYNGVDDKASHAYGNRRTKRTEVMYSEGGISYVYLCYGIHKLFNVVVGKNENPLAVLIRGGYPIEGMERILMNFKKDALTTDLLKGPGRLSKGLGITLADNAKSLTSGRIWVEESAFDFSGSIKTTPRIGVDYAKEDALLPYRFEVSNKLIKEYYE